LYETPEAFESDDVNAIPKALARVCAGELVNSIRAKGRTLLTEAESNSLLAAYDIPTVATEVAANADAAVDSAKRIGYPVVLKLYSETITHKTDVGGVQLNLTGDDAVRAAYRSIKESVTRAAGEDHFLGVTVQSIVRAEGYELILGSRTRNAEPNNLLAVRNMLLAYSSSKAALNMMTVQFANELKSTGIKVNSANPGYTATDMNQHRRPRTVEQGAATPVRLALLPDDGPTGGVFSDEGPEPW
jgi:hypothetical protein